MSTITQFPSGNTQYRIEFDYLARTFVVVTLVNSSNPTLNRVLEAGRDYRFLNPTMIEMLVDQSGFDIVRIHRQTGTDLVVDFRNGSVLTASDLTNAELQAIHIAEEGRDQTVDLAKEYADAAWSSAGNAKDSEDEARRIAETIRAANLVGYVTRRSFERGFNVTTWNEALLWEEDGDYYRWDGTLPKNVPAGSTPETSGGIGLGAWVSVGDATLRNQISDPDGAAKYPRLQIARWRDEGDVRGWGAGEEGFNAAMSELSANGGGTLFVNEDILFTSLPIMHKEHVTVRWNAVAKVKSGLTAEYAYIMDGGADTPTYSSSHHFTKANKTNCYNLFLVAEDYTTGISAKGVCVRHCYGWTYEGGAIIGFNNGGFYETNNYEGKASKFTMVVANTRLDNSVGFESNSTDSWFSELSPVGYSIGLKFNKSANVVDKAHPWGNTVNNLVGAIGQMNVGIVITENAGFSTYSNIILDTPVRKNTNETPSRSNGGVGVICDAWDCVLDGILVLPSRHDTVAKSTLPMTTTTQRSTIKDFQVSGEQYVTDIWISFENNSGIARNHISGYGYAEKMRTGMTFGPNSGAILASADGVTMSSQTLTSGIWYNTLSFSIATTITAIPSATGDVIVNIAPAYGVKSGFGGTVKGGMYAFYYATANSAKQLYDVSLEVVSDNTAKFLLTFIDGVTRYARWTDVSNGSARAISISGVINIK